MNDVVTIVYEFADMETRGRLGQVNKSTLERHRDAMRAHPYQSDKLVYEMNEGRFPDNIMDLLQYYDTRLAFARTCKYGRLDIIDALLPTLEEYPWFALKCHGAVSAARARRMDVLKRLNIATIWDPCSDIICAAVKSGDLTIARYVIDEFEQSDCDLADSVYIEAVLINNVEMLELLLAYGAYVDINYDQAIDVAIRNGNEAMVRLLMREGADIRYIPDYREYIAEIENENIKKLFDEHA